MKKNLYSFLILALCAMLFTHCKDKETGTGLLGITINKDQVYIAPAATETLSVSFLPDNSYSTSIVWSSDKPEIATVHPTTGVVTAIRAGRAIIMAKTEDGSHLNTCYVDVRGASIPATLTVGVGESKNYTLIYGDIGDKKYKKTVVSSNDDAIATIDTSTAAPTVVAPGTVTIKGISTGTTTVTVKLTDRYGTYELSSEITVVEKVESLKLSNYYYLLGTVDGTRQSINLPYTISPAGNAVIWTTSNAAAVTVDNNGKISAVAPGYATITGTSVVNNKSVSCNVEVLDVKMTKLMMYVIQTGTTPTSDNFSNPDFGIAASATFSSTLNAYSMTLKRYTLPYGKFVPFVYSNYQDDQSVTWSSGDQSIATVDADGLIHALLPTPKDGDTNLPITITATSNADPSKTVRCLITISDN